MTTVLLVACVMLPLTAVLLPAHLLQRYGVPLVALSALTNMLFMSLVAFGADDGESRWRTHGSGHAYIRLR